MENIIIKTIMENKKPKIDTQPPKEESVIIEEVLKKYDLWKNEDVEFEEFLSDPINNENLILKSSGYKLSNLIKKYADKELLLRDVPASLKNEFNLSEEKAEKMAEELNEKIFRFIKPTTEATIEKPATEEPLKKSPEKDAYRELVE